MALTSDVQALSVKVDQNHIAMESYIDRRMESFEAVVNQRFDRIESDVSSLKSDVSELKSDMSDMKSGIAEIKTLLKEKLK